MMKSPGRSEKGFSLIELLIVVAVMGLIMGAIYSLFNVHRNTAYSQLEVVEVQQNLRVALDNISRDLRMAGIMMPITTNPIPEASGSPSFPTYATDIRINIASASRFFARVISQAGTGTGTGVTALDLTVESPATASSPNVVDYFATNDYVRIIRPVDGGQPITPGAAGPPFRVTGLDSSASTITISRQDSTNFNPDETVVPGDMIAKVSGAAATIPETVDYYLENGGTTINGVTCPSNEKCLVRRVNSAAGGTTDIIATKMSSISFGYLNDSNEEVSVPSSSELESIRAVRVTLQGATAATAALSGGGRSRAITSVIKLRNRR